ncbi:hypothetical protein A6S26_09095 [Nostoc sp. ATCC 43529]|nr:hypothetical protein A6S26_09095 [Nostoc sp. ATCC 43529]
MHAMILGDSLYFCVHWGACALNYIVFFLDQLLVENVPALTQAKSSLPGLSVIHVSPIEWSGSGKVMDSGLLNTVAAS